MTAGVFVMKWELVDENKISLVSQKFLKEFLDFMEQALLDKKILSSLPTQKLSLVFLASADMKALNKKFLNKNAVTDVLSFSPVHEDSLGELVLCPEKIQLQAKDQGLTVEDETAYLILHGFLHLLGYEHEKGGEEAKEMYKVQDEVFHKWQSLKK